MTKEFVLSDYEKIIISDKYKNICEMHGKNGTKDYYGIIFPIKFTDEVQDKIASISKLDCPSIINVVGYGKDVDNSQLIIFTKVALKIRLSDLFKESSNDNKFEKFTRNQRYIVALGIAFGMRYIHKLNFIHRNLHPIDIWLDDKYYPYISLLDFDADSNAIGIDGADIYKAPEINANSPKYTESSDVFAYSRIVYQLLTNKDPSQICLDNLNPKEIGDDMIFFFNTCLNTNPNERFSFETITDAFLTDECKKEFHVKLDEKEVKDYISNNGYEVGSDSSSTSGNPHSLKPSKKREEEGRGTGPEKKVEKNPDQSSDSKPKSQSSKTSSKPDEKGKGKANPENKTETTENNSDQDNDPKPEKQQPESSLIDIEAKFIRYKNKADKGNLKAMLKCAHHLYEGYNGISNYTEAASYYKKAADEKNSAEAMCKYGDMLRYGLGVKIDYDEAEKYYKNSFKNGFEEAKKHYDSLKKMLKIQPIEDDTE